MGLVPAPGLLRPRGEAMTDATEAARRVLRDNLGWRHREDDPEPDAVIVARALLAGQDEVIERCARIADDVMRNREVNRDEVGRTLAIAISNRIRALKGSKP